MENGSFMKSSAIWLDMCVWILKRCLYSKDSILFIKLKYNKFTDNFILAYN